MANQTPLTNQQVLARAFVAFERMIHNSIYAREAFLKRLGDPRRDIADECGHPKGFISAEDLQILYDEDGIARRVVEVLPNECWQVAPTVYEEEDQETHTPFEEGWLDLPRQLNGEYSWYREEEGSPIWELLHRADVLSGIGQYGVILLGVDDGQPLSTPLPMRRNSIYSTVSSVSTTPSDISSRKLLYANCFPESQARISALDDDQRSPRYGQPVLYNITFNDPRANVSGGITGYNTSNEEVHWSRVVHLADNIGSSKIFASPRARPVVPRILDCIKLHGSSAEMYYKGAFPGISFETHPELGGEVDLPEGELKDQLERYMNSLQRYLISWGFTARTLAPQVVDPSPQVRIQLEAICIRLGMPLRIFMGSERGQLASAQDDANWNKRLQHRQTRYLTPRVIRPFVDRLIAIGCLPVPNYRRKNRGYCVHWPDMQAQTESDRATNAQKLTQALMQYATSGAERHMSPIDYFAYIFGLKESEVIEIVAKAKEYAKTLPPTPPGGPGTFSGKEGVGTAPSTSSGNDSATKPSSNGGSY